MDDALVVRRREATRHLEGDLDGLAQRQGSPLQPLAQALAVQELRDEVGRPVVRPDVVHDDDVRVVQQALGPGLLFEAS